MTAAQVVIKMPAFWLLVLLTLSVILAALIEGFVHRLYLKRITIRIHVNGTRGKSSVTRLIAAGLREGDITTCAKTTGTPKAKRINNPPNNNTVVSSILI